MGARLGSFEFWLSVGSVNIVASLSYFLYKARWRYRTVPDALQDRRVRHCFTGEHGFGTYRINLLN